MMKKTIAAHLPSWPIRRLPAPSPLAGEGWGGGGGRAWRGGQIETSWLSLGVSWIALRWRRAASRPPTPSLPREGGGGNSRAWGVSCALAVVLWLAAAPAGAVSVERVVSAGGIEAWLVAEDTIPILSMRLAFRGGARRDPIGKAGLANLVSGLLDEGAGELGALAFQKRLDDLAVRYSANASRDGFSVTLTTLSEHRDEAFGLLALALTEPRFDTDAVERIRQQILTSLANQAKDPNRVARRLWAAAAFPDHPYGRPTQGTPDEVAALSADDLRRFVTDSFAKDVLVIGVAGDITAGELGPLLDRTFGRLPDTAKAVSVPDIAPSAPGALIVERMPVPQSVVAFGHEGLPRDHPDYYTAYVINHVLGGGFSSRLTTEVREKRGLAYGIYSYLLPLDHAAVFAGGVATANARVSETIEVVRAELTRMRDHAVSEDELADSKTYLTGSFPLRLDSNGEIASFLVAMQLAKLGIDYLDRRNGFIEAVTIEDARRVARELFAPERLSIVVVGDPENLEPTAQ